MPASAETDGDVLLVRQVRRMLAGVAGVGRGDPVPEAKLVVGGVETALPAPMTLLLARAAELMGAGRAVDVISPEQELSAQEAAGQLGVSRPYLMNLLRKGLIPYRMVGTHHRIRVEDLLAYQRAQAPRRRAAIDALARETEALGHCRVAADRGSR